MAKSAMESLFRKLEGEDPESNNIDITVVVEADADAAEDIITAQEEGEASAEADSLAETEEASQDQANDLDEMAAVLRKHGMTAGMHAACSVLLPLNELGITMRGLEDLDAAGKNQADADRLAAALEAKAEGFWSSTKAFLSKMWERIKALFRMIATSVGTVKGRVDRARKSLTGRVFDSEAAKDVKFKDVNKSGFDTFTSGVGSGGTALIALTEVLNSTKDPKFTIGSDAEKVLKVIGQKAKKDGDKIVGIEAQEGEFLKMEDYKVTSEIFSSYQAGGARAKAVDTTVDAYNGLGDKSKSLKATMAIAESEANFSIKNDRNGNDESRESLKSAIAATRSQVAVALQLASKFAGACKVIANGYIKGCAGCRRASKAA